MHLHVMAALATAPAPSAQVKIEGAVSMDTKVSWTAVAGAAAHYRVWWRDTTAPHWSNSQLVADATSLVLKDEQNDSCGRASYCCKQL